jgi:hypothetical protein
MRIPVLVLTGLVVSGLAACGPVKPSHEPDTLAYGAFGTNGDEDVQALDIATFNLSRAIHRPMKAAEAMAALEFIAQEFKSNPRWVALDPLTRKEIENARRTVRSELGISPTAPSQNVVNTMLALSTALQTKDQAQIQQLLSNPIFTLPPDQVLQRLANVPYNAQINAATTSADDQISEQ